jgi:hypothetical protein
VQNYTFFSQPPNIFSIVLEKIFSLSSLRSPQDHILRTSLSQQLFKKNAFSKDPAFKTGGQRYILFGVGANFLRKHA